MAKGKVTVERIKDTIRLRFRVDGKQQAFYPGLGYTSDNLLRAELLKRQIETDIDTGEFDRTLKRYKVDKPKDNKSLLTAFESFTAYKTKRVEQGTLYKYWALINILKNSKLGNKCYLSVTEEDAEKFVLKLLENAEPITVKDKVCILGACYKWLKAPVNPWVEAQNLIKVTPKQPRDAFSKHEVNMIISEFEDWYPHYLPFVKFAFQTGCRSGEQVNLTWGSISTEFKTCWILSTKTNKARRIPLPENLQELLKHIKPSDAKSTDLVFKTFEGHKVNLNNFNNRYWKVVLETCSIEYRPFYCTRHTAATRFLEAGVSPVAVAQILGHDIKVLMKNYANLIDCPELPQMF
ncbi:site-specific integrase [Gloeocapsopsis sp. IPPAS B-1203]|nr:site-specific integrase [Gloeocapsopsis sp. IPPAS B-1203]